MTFRTDINFLRGIAILAVLLFHFNIPFFSGGFVGVDIFFVISGFLISNIIINKLAYNQLSLISFFSHRIRRIVPALFFLLLTCLILGWWWLAPADYKELGKEAAYASLFFSNHLFFKDTGYFATESETKLLLHTWTLGVEWQFYLIFPFLILLLHRLWPRNISNIIGIITIASFFLSFWLSYHKPDAAFFLLPSRVWEFTIGTMLVLNKHKKISESVSGYLAYSGLLLLFISIFFFNDAIRYPGVLALFPTLGAAFIILSRGEKLSPIINFQPIQMLGNLSYSLYLWHWPVYVTFMYYQNHSPTRMLLFVIISLALVMTCVSYYCIEIPAKKRLQCSHNGYSILLLCLCCALIYPTSRWIQSTQGMANKHRLSQQALIYAQGADDFPKETNTCLWGEEKNRYTDHKNFCNYPGDPHKSKIFLWGDSHANALRDIVKEIAKKANRDLITATISACPPLTIGASPSRTPDICVSGNKKALQEIQKYPGSTVILVARWSAYLLGKNEQHKDPYDMVWTPDLKQLPQYMDLDQRTKAFKKALIDTSCALHNNGATVAIVEPIPEIGISVPSALVRKEMYQSNQEIRLRKNIYDHRHQLIHQILQDIQQKCSVELVSPEAVLCDNQYCQIEQNGYSLYFDDDHLSTRGAALLKPILEPIID